MGTSYIGDDSFLAGAIFMSNRATKKECLSRKLFGLPSFQASFVEKIKMGMILFLFEYEERKLYGVFEATSDGATNIVPMAFSSSGKLFSAQVSFRVIWHCYPLTEGDFFDAIKENYYAPNKFHFHLSGKQVCKLLELFDLRKQCGRGYKSIPEFSHSGKKSGKRCQNFRSGKHELNKESGTDLNMYSDLPGSSLGQLMYHETSLQNVDNANVGVEDALQPLYSYSEQPELPDMVNSAYQSLHSFRGNIPVNPEGGSFYQEGPHMCLKRSPISSRMNISSLDELSCYVGSFDSHPSSRCQNYHSYPDEEMHSIGVHSNFQDESNSLPTLASKDSRERLRFNYLQDSIGKKLSNSVSITNSNIAGHHISSPRFNDHYAPDISSLSQMNNTKHHLDVGKFLQSPANVGLFAYCHCATTSQYDEKLRRPQYYLLKPREIISSPNNLEAMESSFCSITEKILFSVPSSTGCSKYQDDLSSCSHLPEDDKHYTAATISKFDSDSQKRTSVFLRLSKLKKGPAKKVVRYNPDIDVSLDELVSHISSKQKCWCRLTEVPSFNKPTKREVPEFKRTKLPPAFKNIKEASDQFFMFDNDGQVENSCQLASEPALLCDTEQLLSQEGTNGTLLPFLNFKRRSETQRKTCGTEPSNSVEVGDNALSLVKHKRRKLLRPSFEEAASNKVAEFQNVVEDTQELFLKEDGDSSESAFTTMSNGNKIHESSSGVSVASQEHLTREVHDTLGENVGNVRSASVQMNLSFEGTIAINDENKFLNVQESSQDLHRLPLLVVDGDSSADDRCNTKGRKKMEMVLLHTHSDDGESYSVDITSGGQCNLQNMVSPCKHFNVGPLFVKVGENVGVEVEQDVTSYITGSESERRDKPKYSGECKSCSCYSEVFSKRDHCQISASGGQDSEVGELSSNHSLGHGKATEKVGENISERLHVPKCDWKNTVDPQGSLSKTQEHDPSTRVHFTKSDSDITGDPQCNLFKITVEGGRPLSSANDIYSAEASVDAEVGAGVQGFNIAVSSATDLYSAEASRDGAVGAGGKGFDSTSAIRVGFCGKKPLHAVDIEMNASHQDLLFATEDTQPTGSLSKPHIVQSRTANYVVVDKDNAKSRGGQFKQAEPLVPGEAAKSTKRGNTEIRFPEKFDNNHTKCMT